ncbi:hypothetical protein SteCoe_14961 [Stentor coeruleus]|uniref:RCC1-like domain-containing protein n=1 Tax=Stentor coeruleus TaxID=5963 RepID=A0A1R2C4Q5_9CILI|nr:hypothetical protein SteCoe_14961 [Stentor coeruleus]
MKQWKFRSRNTNQIRLHDFSKDFHKESSRTTQININSYKITKDQSEKTSKVHVQSLDLQIHKSLKSMSLVSWGEGKEGSLGNCKTESTTIPTNVHNFIGKTVLQISCGAGNNLVLTSDNKIYTWGFNSVGQLGIGSFKNKSVPCLVDYNFGIVKKTVSGAGHCMVINDQGELFSWGCAGFYQTGHGKLDHSPRPEKVEYFSNKHVIDAACGISHSLVIADREIYAFGDNAHSQCTGKSDYYARPILVKLSKVKKIAAGGAHSVFLTEDGKVFACGLNACGQVGVGARETVIEPEEIKVPLSKQIFAGEEMSAVITWDNKVYVWGWNGFGQLGQGHFAEVMYPVKIDVPEDIIKVSLGVSSTALVTFDKKLYIAGYIGSCINSDIKKHAVCVDKKLSCFEYALKDAMVSDIAVGRTHCIAYVEKVIEMNHNDSFEVLECAMKGTFLKNIPVDLCENEDEPNVPSFVSKDVNDCFNEDDVAECEYGFRQERRWNCVEDNVEGMIEDVLNDSDDSLKLPQIAHRENSIENMKKKQKNADNTLLTLLTFQKTKEHARELMKNFRFIDIQPHPCKTFTEDRQSFSLKPLVEETKPLTAKLHSEEKFMGNEMKKKNDRKLKTLDKDTFKESVSGMTSTMNNFLPTVAQTTTIQQQRIKDLELLATRYDKKISKYHEQVSEKVRQIKIMKRTGGGYLG